MPADAVGSLKQVKIDAMADGAGNGGNCAPTALVGALVDVLRMLGTELAAAEGVEDVRGTEEWSRLCTLVGLVAQVQGGAGAAGDALVPAAQLKCVLEFPLLQGANLIPDAAAFNKKLIKETPRICTRRPSTTCSLR